MPRILGYGLQISQRWLTVALIFLGFISLYTTRVCLSLTITEMTFRPNKTSVSSDVTCPNNNDSNNTVTGLRKNSNKNKYDWSEKTQGIILSSFYWGYILTNIVSSTISKKIGAKHTFGLSILFASVFTLLTPYCIHCGGSTALIILRLVMGLGEGPAHPALFDLLAQWIPEDERSKAGALIYSAAPLGIIFGMLISGVILQHSDMGWPMVFYFYGGIGVASSLLICAFCYSKPTENPYITVQELNYLKSKLRHTHSKPGSTPWRLILKSPAVWALVLITVGNAWEFLTIISDMPKYMSSVLKFSVQANGLLSSIPHLTMLIGGSLTSWIADKVIAKKLISVSYVRKVGCTMGTLGPGIFLIAASYAGCNSLLVMILLTIGLTLMGLNFFSSGVNALDLSPNYAGAITGLTTAISTTAGMLSPYIVGLMTPNQTINEWRSVFWIIFGVLVVTSVFYLIYGSGQVQKWNNPGFFNDVSPTHKDEIKEGVELLPVNTV